MKLRATLPPIEIEVEQLPDGTVAVRVVGSSTTLRAPPEQPRRGRPPKGDGEIPHPAGSIDRERVPPPATFQDRLLVLMADGKPRTMEQIAQAFGYRFGRFTGAQIHAVRALQSAGMLEQVGRAPITWRAPNVDDD